MSTDSNRDRDRLPELTSSHETNSLKDLNQKLLLAVTNGDVSLAQTLISSNADPQCHQHPHGSLLHAAMMSDSSDMIDYVLGLNLTNIQPIYIRRDSYPPIVYAARHGKYNSIKHLMNIDQEKYLKQVSNSNSSLLHQAAISNNTDLINYLIELGLEVDAVDWNGFTPFMEATFDGKVDSMKCLLQHNASSEFSEDMTNGQSLLHYAAMNNSKEMIDYVITLLKDDNGNDGDYDEGDDIDGDEQEVDNDENGNQLPPIQPALAEVLNLQDFNGKTALLVAAENNKFDAVQHLIQLRADVRYSDYKEQGLLHHAVLSNNIDLVKYVLKLKHIDIEAQDSELSTPLFTAAYVTGLDIMKLLIESNAKINHLDAKRSTLLHATIHSFLVPGKTNEECNEMKFEVVEYLLSPSLSQFNDFFITTQDKEGRTALFNATSSTNPNIVKRLLDAKSNVNQQNNNKQSIFHSLCFNPKCEEIFDIITQCGQQFDLNIESPNYMYKTPLFGAMTQKKFQLAGKMLLYKADINNIGYQLPAETVASFQNAINAGDHDQIVQLLTNNIQAPITPQFDIFGFRP